MSSAKVIIVEENIPFSSLPEEVRMDLILSGKARYGEKFLQYDRKSKKVNVLKPKDLELRSGKPVFDIQTKQRKLSKEVQALLEEDANLREQLDEMQTLIEQVPELKSELEKLALEYRAVKAQNEQMMKIVNDALGSDMNLNDEELIKELRGIIQTCKENLQTQGERTEQVLLQLKEQLQTCQEKDTQKDVEISSLSLQLKESQRELQEMRVSLTEMKDVAGNCDMIQQMLEEKEREISRVRDELESLSRQNEELMLKLFQKSSNPDCSMYISEISKIQEECLLKLQEQSELNREMNEVQGEELKMIQRLLDELQVQNKNLLSLNKELNNKLRDCEESEESIEIDILKLENETLKMEIDKLKEKVLHLQYEEQKEASDYEDEIIHGMEEIEREKAKEKKLIYSNEKLSEISGQILIQNEELLQRLRFYAEHLCELCNTTEEQKSQILEDLYQLEYASAQSKSDFTKIKL